MVFVFFSVDLLELVYLDNPWAVTCTQFVFGKKENVNDKPIATHPIVVVFEF